MPEIVVTYVTDAERLTLVATYEGQGLQMMHDEIRNGINTLIFDDPEVVPPIPRTRRDDLYDKLRDDTATLPDIRELLRLEKGL